MVNKKIKDEQLLSPAKNTLYDLLFCNNGGTVWKSVAIPMKLNGLNYNAKNAYFDKHHVVKMGNLFNTVFEYLLMRISKP